MSEFEFFLTLSLRLKNPDDGPLLMLFYAEKWNRNRRKPRFPNHYVERNSAAFSALFSCILFFVAYAMPAVHVGLFYNHVLSIGLGEVRQRGAETVYNIFYAPCLMLFRNK